MTQGNQRDVDVVVIGAGIIGSATAYNLAKKGARVHVFDKGEPGAQQSSLNGGWIRVQGRALAEIPLMIESRRIWSALDQEIGTGVDWVQGGNLGIAKDRGHLGALEEWIRLAEPFNLDSRMVDGAEIKRLVPTMRGEWLGGIFSPSDGHADPRKAATGFARAAASAGVTMHPNTPVHEVLTSGGRVSGVRTSQLTVKAATIICAAGADSARVARAVGLRLPLRIVRSTVARTLPTERVTEAAVWAPRVAFRQQGDGRFVLTPGPLADYDLTVDSFRDVRLFVSNYWKNRESVRLHAGRLLLRDIFTRIRKRVSGDKSWHDPLPSVAKPSSDRVDRCMEEHRQLFPELGDVALDTCWAGYIDTTPDALPVIGEPKRLPGFFFATGFSGHGFAMAPATGKLVADLILDGASAHDLRPFRFERFEERQVGEARSLI